MTVEFFGEQIDKYERAKFKPYLGFISPNGLLVDYNTRLGTGHGDFGNLITWTFLLWIKESNAFKSLQLHDYKINAEMDLETGRIKNANIANGKHIEESNLLLLQRDLLEFLKKSEKSEDFINSIIKRIDYSKIPFYVKDNKKIPLYFGNKGKESLYEIENVFGRYNTKELLVLLKDICIQYLYYDAIEQVDPKGKLLTIPEDIDDNYTIFDRSRTITTTSNNIHERFFNYLLMDWKIQEVPKFIYNKKANKYDIDSKVFFLEKDEVYETEIESIKKLVPLKERPKYFI